jgi:uncharacterized protein (UPF0276 family)
LQRSQQAASSGKLPRAGLGLKPEHYQDVLVLAEGLAGFSADKPWFEIHTENYFVAGGPRLDYLRAINEHFALSFHGVGGSLGYDAEAMPDHLRQVKALVDEFQPQFISEHAVWSRFQGRYYADLLPLPRTGVALQTLIDGIDYYQSAIDRCIFIENPSNYLDFCSDMDEPEFLVEAARRSGCGLLIDINNLYISSRNTGIDAADYLAKIPPELVGELHIAGHDADPDLGQQLLIDSHAAAIVAPVWSLLEQALDLFGHKPVLIERDANIPPFSELMDELHIASRYLERVESKPPAVGGRGERAGFL